MSSLKVGRNTLTIKKGLFRFFPYSIYHLNYSWRHGSSNKLPALQAQSHEFKLQHHQKEKLHLWEKTAFMGKCY
jgi:hypothetical protein